MNTSEINIQARLDLIKSAQRRSSYSYLAMVIISAAFLIVLYNAYLSWDRTFAFNENFKGSVVTKVLQRNMLNNWTSNQVVSIDLLGIRIGVADFTVLGGAGLMIISMWFLLNIKRENFAIGTFLIETKDEPKSKREIVFNYISSNLIFSNSINNKPIDSLDSVDDILIHTKNQWYNRLDITLFFFPSIVVFLSILADILSVFILASPFRQNNTSTLAASLETSDWIVFYAIVALGLAWLFMIVTLNFKSYKYEKATKDILINYEKIGK